MLLDLLLHLHEGVGGTQLGIFELAVGLLQGLELTQVTQVAKGASCVMSWEHTLTWMLDHLLPVISLPLASVFLLRFVHEDLGLTQVAVVVPAPQRRNRAHAFHVVLPCLLRIGLSFDMFDVEYDVRLFIFDDQRALVADRRR